MSDTDMIDYRSHSPATVSVPKGDAMRKWINGINGWTEWMTAAGRSPSTIATRRYQLGRLAEARLRRSPWRLSTTDLAGWLGSHDWDPATLGTYRSAIRSFYKWARIAGHIRHDPALDLPTVTVPPGQPRPAPERIIDAALIAANDRDRLILALAATAGLRRAEIAGLRWEHIADTHLRIRGKGRKIRIVPLRFELAAELAAEQSRRNAGQLGSGYRYSAGIDSDGGWVFPGRLGGHLNPAVIGRAATEALGGNYTCHTLRHSFATRVLDATGDLAATQDLLGHASPATTRIYARTSTRALRAAIDAL